MTQDGTQRAVGVARLGHDLEAVLRLEQEAQAGTDDGMVVGEHDANGHSGHTTRWASATGRLGGV